MSNIYLNPKFLETKRSEIVADGVMQADADRHIADFLSKKLGDNHEFTQNYKTLQSKTSDPKAVSSYLDYKIYGSTKPENRFSPIIKKEPFTELNTDNFADPRNRPFNPLVKLGTNIKRDATEAIQEGGAEVSDALDRQGEGDQGAIDTAAEIVGETGKAAGKIFGSVLMNTLSAVTPDAIEEPVKRKAVEGFQALLETEAGQAAAEKIAGISEWYAELEESDPVMAERIDSALGIGQLAMTLVGAEKLISGGQKVARKVVGKIDDVIEGQGNALIAAGEKTAAKAVDKLDDVATRLVQPKATTKVIKETTERSPELVQKGTLLKKGKLLASKRETELATTAKKIQGFGETDDVVKNAQLVKTAKSDMANSVRESLQNSKSGRVALPKTESVSKVTKTLVDTADDFGESKGIFESTGRIWSRVRSKHPGTELGEWDARIAFDAELEKRFGASIFEKGSARAVAVRAVRETSNELIHANAIKKGVDFSDSLKSMSHMYEILENLSTKVDMKTLNSGLKNLAISPLGRVGTSAAGAGAGVSLIP